MATFKIRVVKSGDAFYSLKENKYTIKIVNYNGMLNDATLVVPQLPGIEY